MTGLHRFRSMGCEVLVGGAALAEARAVEALFAERDRAFSRFRPDSELSRVNGRAGAPVLVSPLFATTLELALAAAEQTGGLVDPTLGAALESAGYDRDFAALADDPRPPGPPRPGALRDLRVAGRLVQAPPRALLDLNGVVKARAVDDALALLRGEGFVSAGGDLAARGELTVGLPGGGAVRLLRGGLATSGADRRRWRRGGAVCHHLIDPRTGAPARTPWELVTVCGASCTGADVAAKAAFLLGEDGPGWLDERGLPGRFRAAGGEVLLNAAWRRSMREATCT